MPEPWYTYDSFVGWLGDLVCRLWLWVRGLTPESGPLRCGRCGHNGRIYLWGGGCRRFVVPVADR
jgi:hypothetical protein